MRALDRSGAEEWCRAHGYGLNSRSLPALRDSDDCITFPIPADASQRVGLARSDMEAFKEEEELCVWLHDWSVWPSGQWEHLFRRFRASYGIAEDLIARPAHLVSREEFDAAVSIAVYSTLMLWDCHVLGASGRSFLFYSHDEYGRKKIDDAIEPHRGNAS
jgi:hypothetical protein